MSFDYKTFDPKSFDATRPLKTMKRRTIIGAETTEQFIQFIEKRIPQTARRISATVEYVLPITRTFEREPQITNISKITQQPTDPTRTILAWREFGNKVTDEIGAMSLTPPTTQDALDKKMRLLLLELMRTFEDTMWLFMMKGDFFAVEEMNRLSPDYRFATEWTPANDALLANLMEGVNKYLTDWTNDIRTEATQTLFEHAGESSQQIGDAVAQVLGTETRRGGLIARTEIMRAFNRMAEQRYNNAGLEPHWLTAHDAIVCEHCEFKDGKPTSEVGSPPEHPDCRCTEIPRLKE